MAVLEAALVDALRIADPVRRIDALDAVASRCGELVTTVARHRGAAVRELRVGRTWTEVADLLGIRESRARQLAAMPVPEPEGALIP